MNKGFGYMGLRVCTGIENSPILEKQTILIDKNQPNITYIGEYQDNFSKEYDLKDCTGYFAMPGLINAHCHLSNSGAPSKIYGFSEKTQHRLARMLNTWGGKKILLKIMKRNVYTALSAGITTLRSLGDPFFMDIVIRDQIAQNKMIGPRILCSGPPLCITGGHGEVMGHVVDGKTEIRKAVRLNARKRVDCIKLISTGGVMDSRAIGEAGRPQMTIDEISIACNEAHRANLQAATHCESSIGIKEALEGGVDSIEHGAAFSVESLEMMKHNSRTLRGYTYLTPTIAAGMGMATLNPKVTQITPMILANAQQVIQGQIIGLRQCLEKEIPIAIGTDAGVPYSAHYELWKELEYIHHYTKTPISKLLHLVTLGNAKLLGIDEITGSIEVDKSADLIVLKSDPAENLPTLSNPERVVIMGKEILKPKIKRIKALENNPITPLNATNSFYSKKSTPKV